MPTQRQQILFICAKCKKSNMKLMSYAERKGNHQADLFCEDCEVVSEDEEDEDDECFIQYRKEIEEGCPEGHITIWDNHGFRYEEEEEIDGIPMSKYIRSLNEEFCVYCDKKENLHNVNGSSVGDYYSCGCDEDEEEEEAWCYANSTIDTIENDKCFCSVGGCHLPTTFFDGEGNEVVNECEACGNGMSEKNTRYDEEEEGVYCNECFEGTNDENVVKIIKKIKDEIPFVNVKPYSHNLIGLHMTMLEKIAGKQAVLELVKTTELKNLGWGYLLGEDEGEVEGETILLGK